MLIGKVSPPRFLEEQTGFGVGEEKNRDNSVTVRGGEEGVVDSVMISETTGATRIAKVRIRSSKDTRRSATSSQAGTGRRES